MADAELLARGVAVRRYEAGPMAGWLRATARLGAEEERLIDRIAGGTVMTRIGTAERTTAETAIRVRVDLDGTGRTTVETPIGFLDHLLTLFGRHALIDLEVHASGDVQVDEHHTVEDTALVLGRAIDTALGERARDPTLRRRAAADGRGAGPVRGRPRADGRTPTSSRGRIR